MEWSQVKEMQLQSEVEECYQHGIRHGEAATELKQQDASSPDQSHISGTTRGPHKDTNTEPVEPETH